MNNKGKFIGLNQRIPFSVLDAGVSSFINNGLIIREQILQDMLEVTQGTNRASKATAYISQILNRQQHLLKQFSTVLKDTPYFSLKVEDRKALCLCMICLTYPITYDLLIALAQGFKVQDQINKRFISEKIMSIYGSNRTVDIAIDALIPMIIELNTIKRDKVSIYSLSVKQPITSKFIAELIIFTDIKLSGSKSILADDLNFRSWYLYFDLPETIGGSFTHLISKKDSAVGQGYLTIKQ